MTCRHDAYDPNCSSYQSNLDTLRRDYDKQIRGNTPDSEKFTVEDVEEVGSFLVMKVRYPDCKDCTYEGVKIMVFEGVTLKDAIRWRKIDPHFRENNASRSPTESPGPVARFPGTRLGWADALSYAKNTVPGRKE